MGVITGIAWTDHTFNPWMGCQRVSPGCEHCYAEAFVTGRMRLPVWGPPKTTERKRTKQPWKDVLAWDRAAGRDGVRRKVFCSSLADIFEDHPQVAPWRDEALALLAGCTNLDVQLLTKRPQNIRGMVPPAWLAPGGWPKHLWVGTTVEDQRRAEERIDHLLRVPAWVRFLSCEPLLEEVDLDPPRCQHCGRYDVVLADDGATPLCPHCSEPGECGTEMCFGSWLDGDAGPTRPGINWVIVGGESGPGARPFDLAWARKIAGQCREAGVAAFVKQLGAYAVIGGEGHGRWPTRDRAGADPDEWPEDLRVQEFPGGAP